MTKRYSTPTAAVLVAIDMSKHRQEVLIERPEGGRRRRLTVMATKPDYDRLADELAAIGRPILVGFEATGNYHRTLPHRLLTAGFELRLISLVALARTREALHNGWGQERSQGCAGHPAHAADRRHAGLCRSAGRRHQRPPGVVEDARNGLQGQDQTGHRILTPYLPLYARI